MKKDFEKPIIKNKETKCWEWQGKLTFKGYGIYKGKRAHRVSYFIYKGVDAKDLFVCHSCDNRSCVNPKHLWLGTNQDNVTDCNKKGRGASKALKKYYKNNPEEKMRLSDNSKKYWSDPSKRNKASKQQKEHWRNNPHSDKTKKRIGRKNKKHWADPDKRKNMSDKKKEQYRDPELRNKLSESLKAYHETNSVSEKTREKLRKSAKENWSRNKEKRLKSLKKAIKTRKEKYPDWSNFIKQKRKGSIK